MTKSFLASAIILLCATACESETQNPTSSTTGGGSTAQGGTSISSGQSSSEGETGSDIDSGSGNAGGVSSSPSDAGGGGSSPAPVEVSSGGSAPAPEASQSSAPALVISSDRLTASQGILQLSPYGRLANFSLGSARTGGAASLLSNGRLLVAGGRRITGLFGTIYYAVGEFLGVGNELVYSTQTLGYPEVPVDAVLAPLPGGKALLLGGSRHQQSGGGYINGPYAPWVVDPLATELASSVEELPAGARDDCGGESAKFQGAVAIEPFGGSIATNQMGAAGAQWKIAVLKTGSNYLWIYDTAQKSFQCHAFSNLTHLDEVRMAALSNGSLFIWKGNDSKVFDPSANGGAGLLSDSADPSQAVRTQAGVVGIAGGKVAIIGGLSAPATELDTIEVYDTSSNQWTTANARLRKGKYRLFPRFDRVTGHVVL